jgi:ubiquinone/menaquinone biosynthesis C-methylase UbiE
VSWWLGIRDRRRLGAFAEETEALARAVGARPGERLLDIGGGTGVLSERFGAVIVLEPSDKKRSHGASVRPSVKFEDGQAEKIPFPDGHFDCVTAVVSFHHFHDRAKALGEVHRVLRADGHLIIFEFVTTRGPGRFLKWLPVHHGLVDAPELERVVRRAGFRQAGAIDVGRGYLMTATK